MTEGTQLDQSNDQQREPLILRREMPLSRAFLEPRTETEKKLSVIWASLLCMDCVGAEDLYHELGGDSLLALVLVAEIERVFGVRMPVATLVTEPTVARLAAAVDRLKAVSA